MYPVDFAERLKQQKYIDAFNLEEALNRPSPVSIRLNPAKWVYSPVSSASVLWCSNGYYLDSRPLYTFDPLFHAGCYYPQEASGMFLEEAFKQVVTKSSDIRVLDLCGAPGGKSTHLSSLIRDNGFLVANEAIRSRVGILAENVVKWGFGNTIVTNNDPSAFNRLNEYFDLILVDAPCSGEGMFRDLDPRVEWSTENAVLCSERQKRILLDVWPALKESGFLIYSTCTFNPAENEENIKWLSEKTGASSVTLDISKYKGIQEIGYKGITGYGFYPGKITGEGLFLAIVRKAGGSSVTTHKKHGKADNQLTDSDIKTASKLINSSLTNLYRHDDIVYELSLSPEEYHFLGHHLHIIKGGTALFKSRKNDFTPLQELVLFCHIRKNAFPSVELDYLQSVSFLKREKLVLDGIPEGWVIVKYRNVILGFIKNLGKRLNNYFPADWRIRMNVPADAGYRQIEWNIPDLQEESM